MANCPALRLLWRRWLAGAAISLTGGCTGLHEYIDNHFKVGPQYKRPAVPLASDWIDANDPRVNHETTDLRQWWTVFNDPVLNALVCDASLNNLSLKEAGFRVLKARASLGVAVGQFFPQAQNMTGQINQNKISSEAANREFVLQKFYQQYDFGFNLAWEIDFWGRFRRLIESAEADLNATVEDYDQVMVTLLGDVAAAYTQIRTLQQRIEYYKQNVELQKETLILAKARFQGGTVSELDVDQAETVLYQTESVIPQLELQLRQNTNRLSVLLGQPPHDLTHKLGPGAIPTAPTDAVVGIPASMLLRRPDVRAAERRAASACAQIGVAIADFFPQIFITGQIGVSADQVPGLFTPGGWTGLIGPAFRWKLLNYGRILNDVRLHDATFQERIVAYQNSVLKAAEETENGLVTFLKSQAKAEALSKSVVAAKRAVVVVVAQYKGGTVDFNRVSLVEQNLVQVMDQEAQARGEIAQGLIGVYRALGGGWQIRLDKCNPVPAGPSPQAEKTDLSPSQLLPQPKPTDDPDEPKPAQPSLIPSRSAIRLPDSGRRAADRPKSLPPMEEGTVWTTVPTQP